LHLLDFGSRSLIAEFEMKFEPFTITEYYINFLTVEKVYQFEEIWGYC